MAIVRPFKGIRPHGQYGSKVASLPYDVMNRNEAKEMAQGNPYSFLHVVRAEIDVPDEVSQYDDQVYQRASDNLEAMLKNQVLIQDDQPRYYIYRQMMKGRVQTGLVACTSINDYLNNIIKKHELTRPEKEVDRIKNFDTCDANTAPIFLTYRKSDEINHIIREWIKFHDPLYQFTSEDEVTHVVWSIEEEDTIGCLTALFEGVDYLYIADGHHRSASSVKVGLKRREQYPDYDGTEPFNYFMSVIFPDEDLFIMDYNRVVKDLNGFRVDDFLGLVKEKFDVEKWEGTKAYKPMAKHTYGMFLEDQWYVLVAKEGIFDKEDPVKSLDVSILQDNLLDPILGIRDPRRDKRIDFVGGIRGLGELERRAKTDMKVAFSLYPTTMEDLLNIADAEQIMPPKSTWFEPKLRSGLFVHKIG